MRIMEIDLYINSSDNIVVNKSLSSKTEMQCNLKDEGTIRSLTVDVAGAESVLNFNYAYIPAFNRYYYINNITIYRQGYYRLSLSVDVLMSFKSQFLNCKAIINRQQNEWNQYLEDGQLLTYADTVTVTKKFPVEINEANYVLTVAGGDV